ncbi:MAG: flagellar biosynthesis anti-sigma factor FlgM [Planctomycetaceae bacterium]|nr:flagellar biosynthesis anti-sigma factor FlgM [Planctomycetaceae bacterium]
MQVYGASQLHGPQSLQGPHWNRPTAPASGSQPTDSVEFSAAAEAAMNAIDGGEFRADLVARVRAQIADGSYDTPDKMAMAFDAMLDELA